MIKVFNSVLLQGLYSYIYTNLSIRIGFKATQNSEKDFFEILEYIFSFFTNSLFLTILQECFLTFLVDALFTYLFLTCYYLF